MKTLIASLVFIGTLSHIGILVIGLHIGEARAKAEAEKPIVLTKACPPLKTTAWLCDAVERREYAAVCFNRMKRAGK